MPFKNILGSKRKCIPPPIEPFIESKDSLQEKMDNHILFMSPPPIQSFIEQYPSQPPKNQIINNNKRTIPEVLPSKNLENNDNKVVIREVLPPKNQNFNNKRAIPVIQSLKNEITEVVVKDNNEKNYKTPMSKIIQDKVYWADNELNVVREIYHYINTKYWTLSIIVIMLSSLLTIIESIKLIFIDTSNKYLETNNIDDIKHDDNRILYSISKYSLNWNLACDILSLLTGALITFIMSLIRFNKYQTKLEFISNRLMQLTIYKSNIILMQYKVDNIGYNIEEIKAEFLKLEENIYKDSELDKIISENKEAEFRRSADKLKKRGPYRNYFVHVLFKYICCKYRIKNFNNNVETQTY